MQLARPPVGPIILCWFCLQGCIRAQESAGQAEIGFQQYYLAIGSERIANVSGLTLSSAQFIPNVGLLSTSLSPALSNSRFRTGDDHLRLKGLPWKRQHWTFSAGDFLIPGQLVLVPFTNLYFPQIAATGGALEATHGDRTVGFFLGQETVSNTPRVVLRQQTPQTLWGAYFRQRVGTRWLVGARFIDFSTDLAALRKLPNLLMQNNLKSARTLTLNSLYTVAGPLKIYGEATLSVAQQEAPAVVSPTQASFAVGPIVDTKIFTFRANYIAQSAAYFPLLGYYLGDRKGSLGEMKVRPFKRWEIYACASDYRNNVAKDETLPTFRNTSESVGVAAQLPAEISMNAQLSLLDLSTQPTAASAWEKSKNQQETVTLSKRFWRHSFRIAGRDFKDISPHFSQRQRAVEIEDNFHVRRLILGASVRMQRLAANQSRTSLFYRGSAQFQKGPFSVYANFETGSDLQNRTVFATTTISTSVFGGSVTLGRNWEFRGEAYRNNLVTELNPQSIFALQGQGVYIPGTLAALNQWSMYFRVIRKFHWGKPGATDLNRYNVWQAPLKGSVEGFVMERLPEGNRPAEGVSVSIDGRTVTTDSDGRFRFIDVPQGARKVALALQELPAEFDPGKNTQSMIVVHPDKPSRVDLDVIRLVSIEGKVIAPKDAPLESIVIRMLPGERYTTPDAGGNFNFYNMREGEYKIALDDKTLPEFAVPANFEPVPVSVRVGRQLEPVVFQFEIKQPQKPVRQVLDRKIELATAPPTAVKPPDVVTPAAMVVAPPARAAIAPLPTVVKAGIPSRPRLPQAAVAREYKRAGSGVTSKTVRRAIPIHHQRPARARSVASKKLPVYVGNLYLDRRGIFGRP